MYSGEKKTFRESRDVGMSVQEGDEIYRFTTHIVLRLRV
jgi:hypothetical protein